MSVLKPKRKKGFLKHQHDKAHSLGLTFSWVEERDVRGLFAAYKMGAFSDYQVPKEYSPSEFNDFVAGLAKSAYLFTFRGAKDRPLVLLLVADGEMVKTEIVFCPWTTFKEKIAISIMFFLGTAKQLGTVIKVKENSVKFMDHLKWYGVIRKVGDIEFQDHSDYLYQSRLYDSPWVKQLDIGNTDDEDRQAA